MALVLCLITAEAFADVLKMPASVTIPSGVVSIGEYAFDNCANLTKAVLPGTLEAIGDWAFSGCS